VPGLLGLVFELVGEFLRACDSHFRRVPSLAERLLAANSQTDPDRKANLSESLPSRSRVLVFF
jgi:hypothetical protein